LFWPGRKLEAEIRQDLFSKIMKSTLHFFSRFKVGDIVSRITNDTGYMRIFFAFGALAVVNLVFLLVFIVANMIRIHATLTLFCLAPFLLMLVYTRFALPMMHRFSLRQQQAVGDLSAKVTEAFTNVRVIQANGAKEAFQERISGDNEKLYGSNIKLMIMETVVFPLIAFLSGVAQVIVLLYGGYQVVAKQMSIGDILVFNVYITYLAFPLSIAGAILAIYQRAKSAMGRISEIEAEPEEGAIKVSRKIKGDKHCLLEVRDLSFSYPGEDGVSERQDGVISNISFQLYPGKKIGFFGSIGSGKSTLFNIITRLYDPPPGTVFYKGKDVRSYEPEKLRSYIGYGLQTAYLFSESIRENLLFGMDEKTDALLLDRSLTAACMKQEVAALHNGQATQIGEKGVRLSGGQRQRLALARLFLRKPSMLILDDVLSAVDQKTERKLVEELHSIKVSMLIASHRISVLEQCDEVIILDKGRIADHGTFAALSRRHKHLEKEFNAEIKD